MRLILGFLFTKRVSYYKASKVKNVVHLGDTCMKANIPEEIKTATDSKAHHLYPLYICI